MESKKQILNLYDRQERRDSVHPQYERQAAGAVVRHVSRDPSRLSFIIYADLGQDNAARIIEEQVSWYKEQIQGYGLEWKSFDHDQPPHLKQLLKAQGFEEEEQEALLFVDLEKDPSQYLGPVAADVRRVTDLSQLAAVADIQEQVYGENFDWLAKQLQENLTAEPDFWSVYIAFVDDQPACAAWISFPPNSSFAGLWGGATIEQYRGQGLYTAVVAARAQEAARRGYRYLTVDAGPMSKPILEKRGFELLAYTTPFLLKGKA